MIFFNDIDIINQLISQIIGIHFVVIVITEDLISPICIYQMGPVLLKHDLFFV